jgi:hypothetical protein
MKVKDLIEQLQNLPQDARVAVHCEISEDSDMAKKAVILGKEEGPYTKGDNVWFMYGLPKEEKIVFIR